MAEAAASSANNQLKSTQNSLIISEIKDGIVILKDGTLRAVILASAINFDLMSRSEQDAVEYGYQGFLNSLHFPIQIVIRSQKIDLDSYIESLGKIREGQDNTANETDGADATDSFHSAHSSSQLRPLRDSVHFARNAFADRTRSTNSAR